MDSEQRFRGLVEQAIAGIIIPAEILSKPGRLTQLYPLFGIAFPETRAYATEGRIVLSGKTWRYEKRSGHLGDSDIAGSLPIETGGKRPAMNAELVFQTARSGGSGPAIGARPGSVQAAKQVAPAPS